MSHTMKSTTRSVLAFVALAATFAGAQNQVQAQDAFASLDVPARPAAAEGLEELARDLIAGGSGWARAAEIYTDAAELRGTDDPRAADDLRMAGYLHFYLERPQASLLALTEAGDAYLALGDVERAAGAFIDGAWVATQAEMPAVALDLAERGRRLTRSPLLRPEERSAIMRRLGVPDVQ